MNPPEPEATFRSTPAPTPPPEPAHPTAPEISGSKPAAWIPLWVLALGIGLAAGGVSWAAGEASLTRFKLSDAIVYPPNYQQISGYQKVAVTAQIEGRAQVVVERKRAATAFGLLGLCLGAGLGFLGGLASGSSRFAATGALAGGIAATAVGASVSFAVTPLFFRYLDPEQGLLVLFLTHAAIFVTLGAAAGAALGVGLGNRSALVRALFGGLLGGLVGTFAYETANSIAFPLVRTFEVVSTEWLPRLIMNLGVALCVAVIAGLAAGNPARRPVPARAN
jgi:hypothetical protein